MTKFVVTEETPMDYLGSECVICSKVGVKYSVESMDGPYSWVWTCSEDCTTLWILQQK